MALSLSLITAAASLLLGGTANPLSDVGGTVSRPFLRLFSQISDKVRDGQDYVRGIDALRAENDNLRTQMAQAEQQARVGELAASENDRLRSLLNLRVRGQSFTLEPAWVTARSADAWQAAVTLDKGSNQGVEAGDCVIDAAGALIGRVGETGSSWCTLRLVTDGETRLAAKAVQGETIGVLAGDLSLMAQGKLKLDHLTQENLPDPGEKVVTFGTQGQYPSGLLVGTVEEVRDDPGGLTQYGVIRPAAQLDRLGEVFVITGFQEER